MSQEKDCKVHYLNTPYTFRCYNTGSGTKVVEPFSPEPMGLTEEESGLYFDVLEEELEIPIALYDEIKKISKETDYSFEIITQIALLQYIDKYKEAKKKIG